MDDVLKKALETYRAEFGQEFDPSWSPKTEKDIADCIQASGINFSTWRSKHERVWKSLLACTSPIITLGTIAQTVTSTLAPGASAAVGGFISLITACQGVSQAYDYIEEMFDRLGDILARWDLDFKHEVNHLLKDKMQQIMVVILTIIARSRTLIRRSRARQYFKTLVFGKDQKTQELVDELENLVKAEDRTRSALTLERLNSLWEKAIRTESQQSIELLNSAAFKINATTFDEKKEVLVPGTGSWLRHDPLYKAWMKNDISLLLVLGGPGSGKSSLATGLIEELQQIHSSSDLGKPQGATIGYFYINGKYDLTTMLKTMAYQIQFQDPDFKQHAIEVLETNDLLTAKAVWEQLFKTFWASNQHDNRRVILVIDGLDEARSEEVEAFARQIVREVVQSSTKRLQLAVFGRTRLRAELDFIGNGGFVQVDSTKNRDDIAAFIDQELQKVRILRRSTSAERQQYRNKILKCADGVFEWARLLLSRCRNLEKTRILKLLESPPESLDDMIKACFNEISTDEDTDPDLLKHLLTWTAYSRRPMLFGELYTFIRQETDEPHGLLWFHLNTKLSSIFWSRSPQVHQSEDQNIDDNSITILDEEVGWPADVWYALITLSHSRIREYVIGQSTGPGSSKDVINFYPSPPDQAEFQLAMICLKAMQESVTRDDIAASFVVAYPARYLVPHIEQIGLDVIDESDRSEVLQGLIWLFYDPDGHKMLLTDAADSRLGGADAYWRNWLMSSKNTKTVQRWLQQPQCKSLTTDPETLKWIDSSLVSVKSFLSPLVKTAYELWLTTEFPPCPTSILQKPFESIGFILWLLKAFHSMNDAGEIQHSLRDWTSVQISNTILSAEEIQSLANMSKLPKNALWFNQVGLTLFTRRAPVQTKMCLEEAFRLDETLWTAAWGLCQCFLQQKNAKEASQWADVAMKLNPDARQSLEPRMAELLLAAGDVDASLQSARASYEKFNTDMQCQTIYLFTLSWAGDTTGVIKLLKDLHSTETDGQEYSRLTKLLLSGPVVVWKLLGKSYVLSESSQDRRFILDALESGSALLAHSQTERVYFSFQLSLAGLYWAYIDERPARAVNMIKSMIAKSETSDHFLDATLKVKHQVMCSSNLAAPLLELAACQRRESSPDAAETVRSFEQLALDALRRFQSLGPEIGPTHLDACRPALMYGVWLRVHERVEEKRWKPWFRDPILKFLAMLDDSNNLNDIDGILYSSIALHLAGDAASATALTSVPFTRIREHLKADKKGAGERPSPAADERQQTVDPIEVPKPSEGDEEPLVSLLRRATISQQTSNPHSAAPSTATNTTSDDNPLPLTIGGLADSYFCCFICQRKVDRVKGLYTCCLCSWKIYCDVCIHDQDMHLLLGKVCRDTHEKSQVWPVAESVRDEALVEDKVSGEVSLKTSWLEALRAVWEEVDAVSLE